MASDLHMHAHTDSCVLEDTDKHTHTHTHELTHSITCTLSKISHNKEGCN